ncbi:hypothetical protein VD0004_g1282 [Verticillium dahliae]|nr:hypothetical protein VD0004_g1282 [Verticillium dahliae]PNH74975.1 hypothetical protein VD0001_g2583 [Verticillium dahliae]
MIVDALDVFGHQAFVIAVGVAEVPELFARTWSARYLLANFGQE